MQSLFLFWLLRLLEWAFQSVFNSLKEELIDIFLIM